MTPARLSLDNAMDGAARPVDARVQADLLQLFLAHWRAALFGLGVITVAVFVVGQPYANTSAWMAWGATLSANTLLQAMICRRMELAATPEEAVDRWLPKLLVNVGINGSLWGAMLILLSASATAILTSACLFNAMLVFCVVTSPGTRLMNWIAAPPIAAAGAIAIVVHGSPGIYALGYVALIGVVVVFGLKLNAELCATLMARYHAEGLAALLRQQQDLLIESEHQRTLLLERERLTRDMHDGLGSALAYSLAAVERGEVRPAQLGTTLRECIDDLRLVISSLGPDGSDLVAMLASSRERLQRNVDAAGLRFEWAMGDLPPLNWMGPSQSLHVLRMVQEALANAVRHAGAQKVRFDARAIDDEIEITVTDDGTGFDAAAVHGGRGLQSLASRARLLGGQLRVDSKVGGGTRIRLRIPAVQHAQ
jgi:signal transduction histidine kinase